MTKLLKLVYVEWEDSLGCSAGWSFINETGADSDVRPLIARSVGFLGAESDSSVMLLPHIIEETEDRTMQGMGAVTIPRSAIRRIVTLKITSNRVQFATKRAKVRAGRGLAQRG